MPVSAPTRIPAVFMGGSLQGKLTYLTEGAAEPGWRERYTLDHIVWHSVEDHVMSHAVYRLSPILFRAPTAKGEEPSFPRAQSTSPTRKR
jgi:hypothetical protein